MTVSTNIPKNSCGKKCTLYTIHSGWNHSRIVENVHTPFQRRSCKKVNEEKSVNTISKHYSICSILTILSVQDLKWVLALHACKIFAHVMQKVAKSFTHWQCMASPHRGISFAGKNGRNLHHELAKNSNSLVPRFS